MMKLFFSCLLLGLLLLTRQAALCAAPVNKDSEGEPIPAHFSTLWSYKNFIKDKKLLYRKALRLPGSFYLLIYVAVQRKEDRPNWSSDRADGITARLFIYNATTELIEPKLTDEVGRKLGAEKYYESAYCGGLGSLELRDFKVVQKKVVLQQFYAPGTQRSNCYTEIYYDLKTGKIIVKKGDTADSSLGTTVAGERAAANQRALQLMKAGKTWDALGIWKELYGYWKNGPYQTEGPFDEILNNLGFAYWKVKKYPEAEKILLECKLHFPRRASVYLNLADVYRDMGNKQMAFFYYDYFSGLEVTDTQRKYALAELKKLQ